VTVRTSGSSFVSSRPSASVEVAPDRQPTPNNCMYQVERGTRSTQAFHTSRSLFPSVLGFKNVLKERSESFLLDPPEYYDIPFLLTSTIRNSLNNHDWRTIVPVATPIRYQYVVTKRDLTLVTGHSDFN
jgi:hypothetical protein